PKLSTDEDITIGIGRDIIRSIIIRITSDERPIDQRSFIRSGWINFDHKSIRVATIERLTKRPASNPWEIIRIRFTRYIDISSCIEIDSPNILISFSSDIRGVFE